MNPAVKIICRRLVELVATALSASTKAMHPTDISLFWIGNFGNIDSNLGTAKMHDEQIF